MTIDLHQHVWTTPLLDALAARDRLPFVRRADGLTVLHGGGELPYVIDTAAESADRRAQLLDADGVERAVVALSSPIGIETLPHDVAAEVIAAHLDGVLALGERFAAWGPVPVSDPDPADVDDVLRRGCAGISVPACALAGLEALEALGPVLERVQSHGVPLFVHPGGVSAGHAHEAPLTDPLWWRALTDYVFQMQAAWLTFATHGRRELPGLRIVFGMLAGGAPLQSERLATRGGPAIDLRDPLTFYDTSSYGPGLVAAMADWVGPAQLVYGSDRPVVEPLRTGRERALMANAARVMAARGTGVRACVGATEAQVGAPVRATEAQVGAPVRATEAQVGAPVRATEAQVGAPVGATEAQVGAPVGATEAQVGAPVGATEAQVGAPVGATEAQVGAPVGATEARAGAEVVAAT